MLVLNALTADEWEAASDRAVVPLRVDRMATGFEGTLERCELLDDVGVVVARAGSHDLSRTQSLVDASADSGILLEINVAGQSTVAQHGRACVLGPGQAAFYDTGRPYALSFPGRIHCYLVHLPRDCLRVPVAALARGLGRAVPAGIPELALLGRYLGSMLPIAAAQPGPALQW